MNAKVTTKGSKLTIAGFSFDGGEGIGAAKISQKTIDLAPQAGEYVRVWLDYDGKYSTDKHKDHFWQICELAVPDQAYNEIECEDPGTEEPYSVYEPIPVDLDGVEIRVFELPR